jgi:hypothetical protein
MKTVQQKILTDVRPDELLAVDGGNLALAAGAAAAFVVGVAVGVVSGAPAAAAAVASGFTVRKAVDYARDAAHDDSVPVAPAT